MKSLLTVLGLMIASAGSARADISDPGNLSLGGQAVIVGTVTINGNAFNVGGSTLAVKGGSVGIGTSNPAQTLDVAGTAQFGSTGKSTFTATGLLKLTSSGIQWADGSTSTTSAGGGTGNSVLSATQTFSGANTFTNLIVGAAAPYQGINYLLSSSSGTVLAYSTGTTSFHVAAATMVFGGALYATSDTYFQILKSTASIVYWDPTNGFRQFGLRNISPSSISSFTKTMADDMVVAIATADSSGNVIVYDAAWNLPDPGFFIANAEGGMTNIGANSTIGYWECGVTVLRYFDTCINKRAIPVPAPGGVFNLQVINNCSVTASKAASFVVNNFSGSAKTMTFYIASANGSAWVNIDGGSPVSLTSGGLQTSTVSIPTGYHSIIAYAHQNGGGSGECDTNIGGAIPAGVSIVRGRILVRIQTLAILAAFGFAGPVHADVSDPGNLSLGGQAVIVGTVTINGTAFNVGGSTLAVKSGSVGVGTSNPAQTLDVAGTSQFGSTGKSTFTATGLLKLTSSGIQWADGSTSTTSASGGGGGNAVLSATQTFSGANTFTNLINGAAAPYLGVNYVLSTSSGAALAYSTGTTSFHVAAATYVYRGSLYYVGDTAFTIKTSTFSIVYWDPTNGFRQWGLKDLKPHTISSFTTTMADAIVVAISTSDSSGNVYLFDSAWRMPEPGGMYTMMGRQIPNALTASVVASAYNCPSGGNYFGSCYLNRMAQVATAPDDIVLLGPPGNGGNILFAFVVNNTGASSGTMKVMSTSDNVQTYVAVNGGSNGGSVSGHFTAGTTVNSVTIPTGYSSIEIYQGTSGTGSGFLLEATLPANVSIVRGGYW